VESAVPRYEHIFVIVEENKDYGQVIDNEVAPNLSRLAAQYGLATNFYGEAHPSQGNYIAMLAGDTFGIHDNDAYYCRPLKVDPFCPNSARADYVDHTLSARSLADQLEAKGLTWKAYMESLPQPGSLIPRWPSAAHPVAGLPNELYAAKHNGFVLFRHVQNDPRLGQKLVSFTELEHDLATGELPNYAEIVPNQCNDMHGRDASPATPVDCDKANMAALITRGDRVVGELTHKIMASKIWLAPENSAIVITFDEGSKDESQGADLGCCGYQPGNAANSGGGRIPTIVITNHGPRHVVDPTPYNHYSLLRTTEDAFGIQEHLRHAGDEAQGVVPMTPLFATR
jgi:hypothetical protein